MSEMFLFRRTKYKDIVDEYDDIWLIYQNLRYYCIKKFWSIFQTKWYSVELEFS
ncbi:hypothetical protein M153_496000158, partial [Pseudoloma neurophilia]